MTDDPRQRQSQFSPQSELPVQPHMSAPQGESGLAQTPAPQGEPLTVQTPAPQGEPLAVQTPAPQGQPIPVGIPASLGQSVSPDIPAPQGKPLTVQSPAPQGKPPAVQATVSQGAPQAPQETLQFQNEQRKHVHHSYIWLNTIQVVLALLLVMLFTIVPLVIEGAFSSSGTRNLVIGIGIVVLFVIIVGLTILGSVLSYRNLFYELGKEEFNLYSGVISKHRLHVPYQRIQSVNQKATLVQRIIGVCTVSIDTAGGASNKAIVVPYLQNTEAEKLRHELFARKQLVLSGGAATQRTAQQGRATQGSAQAPAAQVSAQAPAGAAVLGYPASAGQSSRNILDMPAEMMAENRGVFGSSPVDTGVVTYHYGLTNKELFLSGLSNSTGFALIVVSVIGGVIGIVQMLLQSAVGRWAYESGVSIASDVASSPWGLGIIIAGAVIVLLVVWLFSILGTCVSYGGFKAMRRGSRIEVERGLLQHHFQGVDVDRVQSVIVKQSFIRKIFGYCELSLGKIDALSGDSNEQQQNVSLGLVVHPFVKMSRVPEILVGLVPEFAGVPTETKPLAKQALRRAVIRRGFLFGGGFWLAIIVTIASVLFNTVVLPSIKESADIIQMFVNYGILGLYALCLVIIVIEIIGAVLWYRGSSYAYNRAFMQVTNGGFSRNSVSFPRKKIQYGFTQSNPFQRRAHVMSINARTAAGIGGTTMKLIDISEEEAKAWLSWVKPRTPRKE